MIRTRAMRVDYADVTAVHDLDLDIAPGEVFGLIGPNGAGKSSTIRVLATLQEPTHGRTWIKGIDVSEDPASARQIIGYMPDLAPVYDDLRCWEFLDLYAGSYFVPRRDRRRRINECLDAVGLNQKRDAMAGTLSRGMTQRLVLAKTILPDPQVLLLDEPASGLDPIARIQLRDLMLDLASQGKTIIVSSHILTELSEFCSSVGIMQKGKMMLSGRIDDVVRHMQPTLRISVRVLERSEELSEHLQTLSPVGNVTPKNGDLLFDFEGEEREAASLLASLIERGFPIVSFTEHKMGIEDIMIGIGASETS
ncbi:MAG: ABC transporter ATP-binding protein [Phycisphaerales bacterium JB043]